MKHLTKTLLLTTTLAALTTTAMALTPTDCMKKLNLPSNITGITYKHNFCSGKADLHITKNGTGLNITAYAKYPGCPLTTGHETDTIQVTTCYADSAQVDGTITDSNHFQSPLGKELGAAPASAINLSDNQITLHGTSGFFPYMSGAIK